MLKVPFTFSEMIVVVQDMATSWSPVLDGLPFKVDKATLHLVGLPLLE
jgi:hypothetical protein